MSLYPLQEVYGFNPNNLEKLHSRKAKKIADDIDKGSWIFDMERAWDLIQETATLLISYDTRSIIGKDFIPCRETLEKFISPYTKKGSAEIIKITNGYPSEEAYIITSPKYKYETAKIKDFAEKNSQFDAFNKIKIECPVIHMHLDTVPPSGLATLTPYIDKETGLIYGRGIIDMKGTAALMPFFLKLFEEQNIDDYMFIVTTDEEVCGSEISTRILQSIDPEIIIDLEPVPLIEGAYADSIAHHFSIELERFLCDYNHLPYIINRISNFLEIEKLDEAGLYISFDDKDLKISIDYNLYNEATSKILYFLLDLLNLNIFSEELAENPGFNATITDNQRMIIEEALKKYGEMIEYPPQSFSQSTSTTDNFKKGDKQRNVTINQNYSTLPVFNNHTGTIIFGACDRNSRHSRFEAGTAEDLYRVLMCVSEIIKNLTKPN